MCFNNIIPFLERNVVETVGFRLVVPISTLFCVPFGTYSDSLQVLREQLIGSNVVFVNLECFSNFSSRSKKCLLQFVFKL